MTVEDPPLSLGSGYPSLLDLLSRNEFNVIIACYKIGEAFSEQVDEE